MDYLSFEKWTKQEFGCLSAVIPRFKLIHSQSYELLKMENDSAAAGAVFSSMSGAMLHRDS